jgi:predicted small secreted protein
MKKVIFVAALVICISTLFASCGGSRGGAGKGCPTTNPHYFKA